MGGKIQFTAKIYPISCSKRDLIKSPALDFTQPDIELKQAAELKLGKSNNSTVQCHYLYSTRVDHLLSASPVDSNSRVLVDSPLVVVVLVLLLVVVVGGGRVKMRRTMNPVLPLRDA